MLLKQVGDIVSSVIAPARFMRIRQFVFVLFGFGRVVGSAGSYKFVAITRMEPVNTIAFTITGVGYEPAGPQVNLCSAPTTKPTSHTQARQQNIS